MAKLESLLTPDSRSIVSFVLRCLPSVRLPEPSKSTLSRLHEHYQAYASMFDRIDRDAVRQAAPVSRLPLDPEPTFVSSKMLADMRRLPNAWSAGYQVRAHDRNLSVTFHAKSDRAAEQTLPTLRRLAVNVLTLLALFGRQNQMDIEYHATPDKKTLPAYRGTIGPVHINSGSTCGSCESIDIWRAEEVAKVLTHEMVHAINMDLPTDPVKTDLVPLYRDFNLSTDGCTSQLATCSTKLQPNEALTELTGIILHTMYVYHALYGKKWVPHKFLSLLDVERQWSLFQTAKVIINAGYGTPSDFVRAKAPRLFKQKSSVFSYIILKAAALYHIDAGVSLLRLSGTTQQTSDMVKQLHDQALSPEFWKDVDACLRVGDDCTQRSFAIRTLRMSAISID